MKGLLHTKVETHRGDATENRLETLCFGGIVANLGL